NGICKTSKGDLCVDLKVVPVDKTSGLPAQDPAVWVSTPAPVFNITDASLIVDPPTDRSKPNLTGWLHISGQVYSGMCNVTPGPDGVIPSIRRYVNEDVEGIELP